MMGREGFENITLAFRELSWMGAHFRPFTKVLRKFRREVTRKTGKSLNREARRSPTRKKAGLARLTFRKTIADNLSKAG
jgi:hypothetical protein